MLQRSARQPSDLASQPIPSLKWTALDLTPLPWPRFVPVLDSFAVDARSDITYGGEAFAPSWCRLAR